MQVRRIYRRGLVAAACAATVALTCGNAGGPKQAIRAALLRDDPGAHVALSFHESRLDDDATADFVVVRDRMGHRTLHLFDGASGQRFEIVRPDWMEHVRSRPGVSFEITFEDLTCDGTQEVLVRYGGGGTIAHAWRLAVLEVGEGSARRIFATTLVRDPSKQGAHTEVRKLTIRAGPGGCPRRLVLHEGELRRGGDDSPYGAEVKRTGRRPVAIYRYDWRKKRYVDTGLAR